jgi:quercetin dioxygenase-like cupin family protein
MPLSSASSSAVRHVRLKELPVEHLTPMIDRQYVHGEQAMLARLLLRKGCVVPEHSHANEQITYVLEGALQFQIQGQEIVVGAGEMLVIPPNLPHSAVALEDTIDLDVFCPPRADWIAGTDSYLRK